MTSPSPEMKPLTIVQRSVLVGIAREVIDALGTADRLQEKPGTLNGERTLAERCRDILRYEATIRELESRVSQSDAVALKDLFDFIDSVHAPNPETQPRFFQLFEAVRPQVYPFARASRSSGEDQPSPSRSREKWRNEAAASAWAIFSRLSDEERLNAKEGIRGHH